MSERKDDEMLLISKVAEATGIPASTLRYWARVGIMPAERRTLDTGPAWYTTIHDAREAAKDAKQGKPRNR